MRTENSLERYKLLVLIFIGLLYSASIAYFFQSLPTARLTSDFFPRWHASRMLLTTERSIYDWANATEISEITGWPLLHQLGYYYPAYLLIFTAPLSILPYGVAHVIWTIFGLWSLWLGMVILARLLLPDLSLNRLTLLLVLVTISVPVFQHTLYAQFNTIGVLALVLTFRAMYRHHYFAAGLWAGGLLFKPQAMLLVLIILLVWTLFNRKRRWFWVGLALVSMVLWGVAELLESNWVVSFLGTLERYEPVSSIIDKIWNPYQMVTLILGGVTLWLTVRLRSVKASSVAFISLLAWTLSINALIVPMFGMMHMVSMGVVFIMLLAGFVERYPSLVLWVWGGIIALLITGILSFVIPLILVGPTGLQITITEVVYRFTMPMVLAFASLPLMFDLRAWLKVTRRQVAA